MLYHKLNTKPLNASLKTLLKRGGRIGLGISAFTPVLALANPTGGQVVGGQATIATPSANGTVITQTSQSAIINWQQFNIGAGQYVQFLQPSSSSVVLNRVIGGSPSSILGSLTANGQVFLVNTNGVYFGKGASIDTQGFLASTLGITDQNFLAHNYVFDEAGAPGAEIVNDGNITAHHSGYVVLAGDYAENDGVIAAQSGHVILASGSKATLSLSGNSLINFAVSQATLASYAGVKNTGSILADGGTVIMTADVANLLKATVVNNTGLVEAHAISDKGGDIYLTASGGNIENAGTLDVSATRSGQAGGDVTLKGDERTTLTSTSNIDAAGQGANGGSLEISGNTIDVRGIANLGKHGKLLLDPGSIQLVSGSTNERGTSGNTTSVGHVGVGFIESKLNAGDSVELVARHNISAATNVHAISATGKGTLDLVAQTGAIKLKGVNINIAGKFQAAASTHASFGYLQAGSISLAAYGGDANLQNATTSAHGAISKYSAKTTTGSLVIAASKITTSGSGADGVALQAKTAINLFASIGSPGDHFAGNVTLKGEGVIASDDIMATGAVKIAASNGVIQVNNTYGGAGLSLAAVGGRIRAGNLSAGSGDIVLSVTGNSGADTITAFRIAQERKGNVSITDTVGKVNLGAVRAYSGSVDIDAKGQALTFSSTTSGAVVPQQVMVTGNVTVVAKNIVNTPAGNFGMQAGATGTLTVDGAWGSGTVGFGDHNVTLLGKTINLDHGIKTNGGINIDGSTSVNIADGTLNYTGTSAAFKLSAAGYNLRVRAAIGTSKAPVNYAVDLTDSNSHIFVERSIYTKSGIAVTETGQSPSGELGVFVGNSDSTAITLSAKGPISIKGGSVHIGDKAPIVISADDGKASTSTDKLTIVASDGPVMIQPAYADAVAESTSKADVDHSVTLHAGANMSISGNQVYLLAGGAYAHASDLGTSATAKADLSISAGGKIKIAGNKVTIAAGLSSNSSVRTSIGGASKKKVTATAEADVSLVAGTDLDITGNTSASIYGGVAYGEVNADLKGQKATATASATVTLSAGGNIKITAPMQVTLRGGTHTGTGSGAFAGTGGSSHAPLATGAVATVALHADVKLNAGDSVNIAAKDISLHAGSDVGGAYVSTSGIFNSSHDHSTHLEETKLTASAKAATAEVSITSDLDITAGKGGVDISASGSLDVHGGDDTAAAIQLNATGAGAHVSDAIDASVAISTKGAMTLHGVNELKVRGGNSAGRGLSSSTFTVGSGGHLSSGHQSHSFHRSQLGGRGDAVLGLSANTGVSLTAGGALTVNGTTAVSVSAGKNAGLDLSIGISAAGTKGITKVSLLSGVSVTAGGALDIQGGSMVQIRGASDAGRDAIIKAVAGTVSMTVGGPLSLSGHSVSLLIHGISPSDTVLVAAGRTVASSAKISASNGAKAAMTAEANVAITAGAGALVITGKDVQLLGGSQAAVDTSILGKRGGSAALTATAGLSLKAGGAFSVSGAVLGIHGGSSLGQGAGIQADAGGAKASLSVDGSVSLTAASATLKGTFITVAAGAAGSHSSVAHSGNRINTDAFSDATALTKFDGAVSISVTNAFTVTAANSIDLRGAALSNGIAAAVVAQGLHAAAAYAADDSLTIKAGSVSLQASKNITIGEQKDTGRSVEVKGSEAGDAAYLEKSAVSITASKALDFTADGTLIIGADQTAGLNASVNAGSAGIATFTGDDSISIKAASVTLAAAQGITIAGAAYAASNAHIQAAGGKATFAENAGVSITAATAFSATLTGSSSNAGLDVSGGYKAGFGARVLASSNGAAKFSVAAGVAITVTGSKGTVSLDTGNVSSTELAIVGGQSAGAHISADVLNGAASVAVASGVSIAAKGAVTITTKDASLNVGEGGSMGDEAKFKAGGKGSKLTATLDGSVSVSGGSLSLDDSGGNIHVHPGSDMGASLSVSAHGPTSVTVTASNRVSLTATGTLTLHGGGMLIGGTSSNSGFLAGKADLQSAFGGKATVTADGSTQLKGASVTLQATNAIVVSGQNRVASSAHMDGGSNGGASKLTADGSVGIQAAGAFTAVAASLQIHAGSNTGRLTRLEASGAAADAALTAEAGISIGAKSVTITDTGALGITAGFQTGSRQTLNALDGGVAKSTLGSQVAITASGNIAIAAVGATLSNGGDAGRHLDLDANFGSAATTITSGIALTAGGTLGLDAGGGSLVLNAQADVTPFAVLTVGLTGTGKLDVSDALTLKAKGALSLSDISNLNINQAALFHKPTVTISGTGTVSGVVDYSVNITGKSVTTQVSGTTSDTPAVGFSDDGIVIKTGINVTDGISKLSFAPLGLGTVQQDALIMSLEPMLSAPQGKTAPTLFSPQASSVTVGSGDCQALLLRDDASRCRLDR